MPHEVAWWVPNTTHTSGVSPEGYMALGVELSSHIWGLRGTQPGGCSTHRGHAAHSPPPENMRPPVGEVCARGARPTLGTQGFIGRSHSANSRESRWTFLVSHAICADASRGGGWPGGPGRSGLLGAAAGARWLFSFLRG